MFSLVLKAKSLFYKLKDTVLGSGILLLPMLSAANLNKFGLFKWCLFFVYIFSKHRSIQVIKSEVFSKPQNTTPKQNKWLPLSVLRDVTDVKDTKPLV